MKKILLFFTCFLILVLFCACNSGELKEDFKENSLLFDMGAKSYDDVEQCVTITDGEIPEVTFTKKEIRTLAKYRYKSDYPVDKLHELIVFPENKPINITVNGETFALYLTPQGDIGVRTSEESGFKLYTADEVYKITPQKYKTIVEY